MSNTSHNNLSLSSSSSSISSPTNNNKIISELILLLKDTNPSPTKLEITILPDRTISRPKKIQNNDNHQEEEDDEYDNDEYDNDKKCDDDDSNYFFVKDGIHLGIHAPNVPLLARLFRKEYYTLRHQLLLSLLLEEKDDDEEDKKKENKEKDNNDILHWNYQQLLWDVTSCLLLLCPDHATVWSDRKRILLQRQQQRQKRQYEDKDKNKNDNKNDNKNNNTILSIWKDEIIYLNLLFSQHSKA